MAKRMVETWAIVRGSDGLTHVFQLLEFGNRELYDPYRYTYCGVQMHRPNEEPRTTPVTCLECHVAQL